MPLNVVEVPLPLAVRLFAPSATEPPLPAKEATVSLPPSVSCPLLTTRAEEEFSRAPDPNVVVPLLTVTAPDPSFALIAPPCSA